MELNIPKAKNILQIEKGKPCDFPLLFPGDSAGARTQDPILKRDVLYQLSY